MRGKLNNLFYGEVLEKPSSAERKPEFLGATERTDYRDKAGYNLIASTEMNIVKVG